MSYDQVHPEIGARLELGVVRQSEISIWTRIRQEDGPVRKQNRP